MPIPLLLLQNLIPPALKRAKALIQLSALTSVDPDCFMGEIIKKTSVMADENNGRVCAFRVSA